MKNAVNKAARATGVCLLCLAALGLVAGTGCDLDQIAGVPAYGDALGASGGWYQYSHTDANTGATFNLTPATDVHSELENYLSEAIVW